MTTQTTPAIYTEPDLQSRGGLPASGPGGANPGNAAQNTSGQAILTGADTPITNFTGSASSLVPPLANFGGQPAPAALPFIPSTGVFTAPQAGLYDVSGALEFVGVAGAAGNLIKASILWTPAGGSPTKVLEGTEAVETATSMVRSVRVSGRVNMGAGDTLQLQGFQNLAASLALTANGPNNTFSVVQLPAVY
jgi:hypothetical protein